MENGLAASMMYGSGKGNTITSAYGGAIPAVKKPAKAKQTKKDGK